MRFNITCWIGQHLHGESNCSNDIQGMDNQRSISKQDTLKLTVSVWKPKHTPAFWLFFPQFKGFYSHKLLSRYFPNKIRDLLMFLLSWRMLPNWLCFFFFFFCWRHDHEYGGNIWRGQSKAVCCLLPAPSISDPFQKTRHTNQQRGFEKNRPTCPKRSSVH